MPSQAQVISGSNPVLVVHRGTQEVGGNCVEIAYGEHRVLLDVGSPLEGAEVTEPREPIPPTLDLSRPVDAVLISHPHLDHTGLLAMLPSDWPAWCGAPTETLIRLTAAMQGKVLPQPFHNYGSSTPFIVEPFTITPRLTDHSAFDAHMLLVEVAGKRMFYSGDFRTTGRKGSLVEQLMRDPPRDVDVLLLEGTALAREGQCTTEAELEQQFVELFRSAPGRVFVSWSAQNIDRTVTLYKACLRARRTLVIDLYAADVLARLAAYRDTLPRLGWRNLRVVVTSRMGSLYKDPRRMNNPAFVEECANSRRAFNAAKLVPDRRNVIMLRPSLLRDYEAKGVVLSRDDTWVYSMWEGYLSKPDYAGVRQRFEDARAVVKLIHTSGHASRDELEHLADRIAAKHLVPIHSFDWDKHLDRFANVRRLADGEPFEIP